MTKKLLKILLLSCFLTSTILAQNVDIGAVYSNAMKEYDAKNYKRASQNITKIIDVRGYKSTNGALYNAASIYS